MALSLSVATGTAGTEWLFHGAVGGQPIGWDPPHSSLSSVGPLLPGSSHCFSRPGKFRHVAAGCTSPGACHLGQRGGSSYLCHFHRDVDVSLLTESLHPFAKFPSETGMVAQMHLVSCGDTGAMQLWLPANWSHTPTDKA